jgi:hypothetical protein
MLKYIGLDDGGEKLPQEWLYRPYLTLQVKNIYFIMNQSWEYFKKNDPSSWCFENYSTYLKEHIRRLLPQTVINSKFQEALQDIVESFDSTEEWKAKAIQLLKKVFVVYQNALCWKLNSFSILGDSPR